MQMRTAAEKAIQLDPLSAEAHQALGMVHARDGRLGAIGKELPSRDRARSERLDGL